MENLGQAQTGEGRKSAPAAFSGEGQRHLENPDALELCGNELPNLRCFHHGHGEDRGWIGRGGALRTELFIPSLGTEVNGY